MDDGSKSSAHTSKLKKRSKDKKQKNKAKNKRESKALSKTVKLIKVDVSNGFDDKMKAVVNKNTKNDTKYIVNNDCGANNNQLIQKRAFGSKWQITFINKIIQRPGK